MSSIGHDAPVTTTEPSRRVWRLAGFGRGIGMVLVGVAVVMAVVLWTGTALRPSAVDALRAVAATGALGAYGGFAWCLTLRPKLVLNDGEIVAVNPWGTTRVPIGDVVGVSAGFTGARLQLRDGWSVRIFALAEAYGGGFSQRHRIAEVADAIAERQRLLGLR